MPTSQQKTIVDAGTARDAAALLRYLADESDPTSAALALRLADELDTAARRIMI